MVSTTFRAMTVNCRLSSFKDHPWNEREPRFIQMLKDTDASIIGVQECDYDKGDQRDDILKGLGAGWKNFRLYKVGFFYDSTKWEKVETHAYSMNNGPDPEDAPRRLVMMQLRSIKTGGMVWVANTHLGTGMPNAHSIRMQQARSMVVLLSRHINAAKEPVVLMGDFNDWPLPPAPGVRAIMRTMGLVDLRTKNATEIENATMNSYHDYKPQLSWGRWLDDLLTGPRISVLDGKLIPTADGPYADCTDHNAVFARLKFES